MCCISPAGARQVVDPARRLIQFPVFTLGILWWHPHPGLKALSVHEMPALVAIYDSYYGDPHQLSDRDVATPSRGDDATRS